MIVTDTTRLTPQGQVALPESLRAAKHWEVGQEFLVMVVDDGIFLKPKPLFEPTTLEDVAGCLHYAGTPKTLIEMEHAIAEGVKQRYDRD
ncbi:Asr3467 protein [Candidatus Moduliflexus flocculans]|uniref:Asr3467 protein n=1 Tax=Candidatus Moduliflexus flocculans TaxID=1499966 RepID=A0A081BQ45_9BACT|nr:Asr3467 protein [Candidatus Moduliflexus flocculans]